MKFQEVVRDKMGLLTGVRIKNFIVNYNEGDTLWNHNLDQEFYREGEDIVYKTSKRTRILKEGRIKRFNYI